MRFCDKCDIKVNNPLQHCPLCYSTLRTMDDCPEPHTYPNYEEKAHRYNLILRILLMLSLSAGTICVMIDFLTTGLFHWSFIVVASITYVWITAHAAMRAHSTLGFKVLTQVASLAALLVIIDRTIADYDFWVYDYVLPFLFVLATMCITIITIIKRVKFREFILYFMLISLLGFIPVILLAAGLVKVAWPSLASALYSALSLISLFVFADTATKIELKKRFHI